VNWRTVHHNCGGRIAAWSIADCAVKCLRCGETFSPIELALTVGIPRRRRYTATRLTGMEIYL